MYAGSSFLVWYGRYLHQLSRPIPSDLWDLLWVFDNNKNIILHKGAFSPIWNWSGHGHNPPNSMSRLRELLKLVKRWLNILITNWFHGYCFIQQSLAFVQIRKFNQNNLDLTWRTHTHEYKWIKELIKYPFLHFCNILCWNST